MEKQYLTVAGFSIAYVELNVNEENTLFLVHGISGSAESWNLQLQDPLLKTYRLIALELPGHGSSSHSSSVLEDFSPIYTGKIMAAAVQQLAGEKPFCLAGISYGTNIVAEMLNHLKPLGIALFSPSVIGADCGLGKLGLNGESIYLKDIVPVNEAREFYADQLADHSREESYIADYYSTQKEFRGALLQNVIAGNFSNETALLREVKVPLLIVFGQLDKLLNKDYLDEVNLPLYKNRLFKIEGAGHFVQTDKPAECNRLFNEYVAECFTINHSA
jgi:pimeloyl-ACP methyl ester carboxylesterase